MKSLVFSVQDKAIGAFLPPFFARSRGEAIRSFSEAVNQKDHQFFRHAADYTLFALGEFDDGSGLMAPTEPMRVVSALEVLVSDDIFPPEKRRAAS